MATIIKQKPILIKGSNHPVTVESITCMAVESCTRLVPVNMIWIYSNKSNLSKENFIPSNYLQVTLSHILNDFPMLSGRITEDSKGDAVVHLTNEGVLYTEAECIDQTLDYFIPQSISSNQEFDYENINNSDLLMSVSSDWTGPCLSIQITYLKCNSVILSISGFHCLVDANSVAFFMNAWASAKLANPEPFFDKSFILYPTDEEQQETIRPKNCVFNRNSNHQFDESKCIVNQQQRVIRRIYHFSVDELKNIKNEASKNLSNSIDYISTYDALFAHLVLVIAEATQTSLKDHVKILQAVNGRPQFVSSYSPSVLNYFGSLAFWLYDKLPIDNKQTLSSLAEFIHEMHSKQTEQSLRDYNTYLMSGHRNEIRDKPDADIINHDFHCTSWRKFHLLSPKFFNSDYPIYSGPADYVYQRFFLMMDANPFDESINIILGLKEQDYERMIQQNNLHKYR